MKTADLICIIRPAVDKKRNMPILNLVHHLPQFFADLEERDLLGRDAYGFTGLRIPRLSCVPGAESEISEAPDFDLIPF